MRVASKAQPGELHELEAAYEARPVKLSAQKLVVFSRPCDPVKF